MTFRVVNLSLLYVYGKKEVTWYKKSENGNVSFHFLELEQGFVCFVFIFILYCFMTSSYISILMQIKFPTELLF